jgi:hypothetical protein
MWWRFVASECASSFYGQEKLSEQEMGRKTMVKVEKGSANE